MGVGYVEGRLCPWVGYVWGSKGMSKGGNSLPYDLSHDACDVTET